MAPRNSSSSKTAPVWLGDRPEFTRLFENDRARVIIDDGRRYLLHQNNSCDVIVSDPTLTWWACGACLYTQELYQLLRSWLNPGGLVAQWIPTERTAATAASVFPFAVAFTGPGFRSGIMVLSYRPIDFEREKALRRLGQTALESAERRQVEATLVNAKVSSIKPGNALLNHDLFPRDEYDDNPRSPF